MFIHVAFRIIIIMRININWIGREKEREHHVESKKIMVYAAGNDSDFVTIQ